MWKGDEESLAFIKTQNSPFPAEVEVKSRDTLFFLHKPTAAKQTQDSIGFYSP